MKNVYAYIGLGVLGVVAIFGLGYVVVGSQDDEVTSSTSMLRSNTSSDMSVSTVQPTTDQSPAPTQPTPSTTTQPVQAAEPAGAGSYTEYYDGAISQIAGTKVLFFHASWCPQCLALERDIEAKGVPAGVTILEVDFDNSQALRSKYGVTQQTTTVLVDDSGGLVKKYGAYSSPTLAAVLNGLGL